ncbi:hypothetical protein J3F84DRAFT_57644 [Trichoderma pleuroticola]
MEQLVVSRTWHGSACICRQTHRAGLGRLFGRSAPWRESYSVWNHQVATICTAPYQACRPLVRMAVRCAPWQPHVFRWKTHSKRATNRLVRGSSYTSRAVQHPGPRHIIWRRFLFLLKDNVCRKEDPSLAFYGIHPVIQRSIAATYWEIAAATDWENGAAGDPVPAPSSYIRTVRPSCFLARGRGAHKPDARRMEQLVLKRQQRGKGKKRK